MSVWRLEVLNLLARDDSSWSRREVAMLSIVWICLGVVVEEWCLRHGLRGVHDGVLVSDLFSFGMSELRILINIQRSALALALLLLC